MDTDTHVTQIVCASLVERIAPRLATLLRYQRSDLPPDILSGLSVAAVPLPVGVAYAELAGFNPAVGLYSSILPLFAYAAFGTSRQLVVGPDAATCAMVTAAVTPLASGDRNLYQSLSVTLAFLAGALCMEAAGPSLKWIVLDMLPITLVDATGPYTVEEIADTLRERGVVLATAGRQTEWRLGPNREACTQRPRDFYLWGLA